MFKPTIHLDMDGVLADFNAKVLEHLGHTLDRYETSQQGWDALGDNRLHIYQALNVFADANSLVDECSTLAGLYGYNLGILTGLPKIGRVPLANQHKREWLSTHFPTLLDHYYIGPWAEDKQKHCKVVDGVCDILIDDQRRNIQQWETVGGYGIMHTCAADTVRQLQEYLHNHRK